MTRWGVRYTPEEARAARQASRERYRAKPEAKETERQYRKKYMEKVSNKEREYVNQMTRSNPDFKMTKTYEQRVATRQKNAVDQSLIGFIYPDIAGDRRKLWSRLYYATKRFNISVDKFMELSLLGCQAAYSGFAEDCGGPLCIDHDHSCCAADNYSCGKCIRGMLCRFHNLKLGMYEKHHKWAKAYLSQYENQKERTA